MDEKTIALVQKITDSIGANKDFIIETYTKWYMASSVCYLLLGFFIIFAGWFIVPKKNESIEDNDAEFILPLAKWILTTIGLLFIVANLPDLISPEGIAIHRLIRDITGK